MSARLEVIEVVDLDLPLLEKLVILEEEAFGRGGLNEWTLPVFVKYGKVFLLKKGNEILGLSQILKSWHDSECAFIVGFSLTKKHRGKGFGKWFFTEILEALKKDRIKQVQLTASLDNLPALRLYKKLGFIKIGEKANLYGKGENRLIMELKFE